MTVRNLIYKLGSNPKRSVKYFIAGLLLCCVAGGFIALGYYHHHLYQVIGLAIALPAILIMAYGYLGIFANRFAQVIQPKKRRF